MSKKLAVLGLLILSSCQASPNAASEGQVGRESSAITLTPKKMVVHFSPKGGCTQAVVDLIGSARTEILVQAYSFTSKPIAAALVAKRGITRVILDSGDDGTPGEALLTSGGVPAWSDRKHAIAHNKVVIVDRKIVETGSFNFTQQAETSNAENCLVIRDADLAAQYAANWEAHLAHSVPVQ